MRYLLATFKLLLGIIQAIIRWLLFLPYILFTLPVDKWNEALYGKPKKVIAFEIKEMKNGKVKIILPNGEVIYADKSNEKEGL